MIRKSFLKEEGLRSKTLQLIKRAGKPVSVSYVAEKLGVHWQTARAILLLLAAEGYLEPIETTKSFIFVLRGGSHGS